DHDRYREWIETYADPEFAALGAWCRELTDAVAGEAGDVPRRRMRDAFVRCSELELGFWEAAWRSG
ncbi:MAG: thiaminase II, partial [Solirubrobacteraceae bacterium]